MNELIPTRKNRRILLCIYGAALLYYVLKLLYYVYFFTDFPDQPAQLSYVLQMSRAPVLLPDFSAMPIYRIKGTENGLTLLKISKNAVNYLGHPPLYYLIMSLFSGASVLTGSTAVIDFLRLRLCNAVLSSATVIMAFRIGYTRLKDRGLTANALFAAAVVTLPEMAYVGASVNNDNLAFFAMMIFLTGLLRYQEDRTDLYTYLLLGIGFMVGGLSKLTTALMMAVILLAVLVMSIIRTRSLKLIANRRFLATLPLYLVFLGYELAVHRKFGTWQPSLSTVAPEYYLTTTFYVAPDKRVSMTLLQYIRHFLGGFGYSWSSLYGQNAQIKTIMNNGVAGLIYWVPVAAAAGTALYQVVCRKTDRYTLPVVLGFFGTLAYHFYSMWTNFQRNGYTGGNQARYYLALIVPFALIMSEYIPPLFRTRRAKVAGAVLAALLILAWLAGDAPRLVLLYGFPAPAI